MPFHSHIHQFPQKTNRSGYQASGKRHVSKPAACSSRRRWRFQERLPGSSSAIRLAASPDGACGISFALCLQYPAAHGTVHTTSDDTKNLNVALIPVLTESDSTKNPAIHPEYMSHIANKHVIGIGLGVCDNITTSKYLAPKLRSRVSPPAEVDLTDVKQAEDLMEDQVLGEYHICVSVARGNALDSQLRVKGMPKD